MTLLGAALAGCASGPSPQPAATISVSWGTPGTPTAAPSVAATAADCEQRTVPRPELAGQLPVGFATVAGWQPTGAMDQARTRVVRGVLPGGPADLEAVRDRAVDQLIDAGYHLTGTDEEAGYEAEAELAGPREVNINVRPLCRAYLVLSYSVRQ